MPVNVQPTEAERQAKEKFLGMFNGGTSVSFNQSAILDEAQSQHMFLCQVNPNAQERHGICFELSTRWAMQVLGGAFDEHWFRVDDAAN